MDIPNAIIFIGALIFFAHLFNIIFTKTKIPVVLVLLLTGLAAGPIAGWIKPEDFGGLGYIFASATLVVILFESGTNLKFSELKKSIGNASLITLINFSLTVLISFILISIFTKLNNLSALFAGTIIGGTSSAIIIPLVKQLRMNENSSGVVIMEAALSDVLCLIAGVSILTGMERGAQTVSDVFNIMWKSVLIAIVAGVVGGFAWSGLILIFRGLKKSMFTSLAAVLVIYGLVESFDYNGGIAALAFGIMLANSSKLNDKKAYKKVFAFNASEINPAEKDFFAEITFILQTFFFVYVGISLRFDNFWLVILGLIIVAAIILSRPLSISILSKKKFTSKDIAIMSILSPKGLIPAVFASLPLQLGLPYGQEIQDITFSVVLFSIVISSILVLFVSKDPLFMKKLFNKNTEGALPDEVAIDSQTTGQATPPAIPPQLP
ncbi:MAG: hypothetical protein A2W91_17535 [Bacteroidetes bacterium GWF2_38_335]|nr:MAG: hypothetical protein A2W91_17535 [Bacteroidetes bacterium GWF2_38_335]OFY78064.1 MAG: hypothetical protein A2281_18925 [Bacteroidetes bacterium RIFOXYA12_FULL_38_20]HBS88336.1 hypothetical protein [Bacteroidales bacterium]